MCCKTDWHVNIGRVNVIDKIGPHDKHCRLGAFTQVGFFGIKMITAMMTLTLFALRHPKNLPTKELMNVLTVWDQICHYFYL